MSVAKVKPSLARGTRDFLPAQVYRRRYIISTMQQVFEKYGYAPIETPAFENLSVLEGKYGEEGDRLMFRILNSGDFLDGYSPNADTTSVALLPHIAEKALRYDLTVPFARFVVMHREELVLPFKRYQLQSVWRADRPQRGRYREFTQCDVDVVGSRALLHEVEFCQIYDEVLSQLGLTNFTIQLNHRKVLSGIAEVVGVPDRIVEICVAIDKLDKIGREGVTTELTTRGFTAETIQLLAPIFELTGTPTAQLSHLRAWLAPSPTGLLGVQELETMFGLLQHVPLQQAQVVLNLALARGLNYYTGAIFEVQTHQVAMGSLGGGGRYDELTALFGVKDMPGAGISFGADRIYEVMEELGLFQDASQGAPKVLLLQFTEAELPAQLTLLQHLRAAGITAELYADPAKLAKQLSYADKRGIPFAIFYGQEEQQAKRMLIKNLKSGVQEAVNVENTQRWLALLQ